LCLDRRAEVLEEHIKHVKDGRAKNNPEKAREAKSNK